MKKDRQPPHIVDQECGIILFDGVCKLCNGWANFIIKYDKKHAFKLCSVQSQEGKAILEHFGFSTQVYETMLYVENKQCFEKSTAFFKIINHLGYPWKLALVFHVLPQTIRDWLYDRIALNRYRIFGKYDYCQLPSKEHVDRYLCDGNENR